MSVSKIVCKEEHYIGTVLSVSGAKVGLKIIYKEILTGEKLYKYEKPATSAGFNLLVPNLKNKY